MSRFPIIIKVRDGLPRPGDAWLAKVCLAARLALAVLSPFAGQAAAPPSWPSTAESDAKALLLHPSPEPVQGLAWNLKDQRLYFSAWGADSEETHIRSRGADGSLETWLKQAEGAAGLQFSRRGHLLAAQTLGHRVLSYSVGRRGPRRIALLLELSSLNQPNDLCEAPNGDLYLTDPDFLHHSRSSVYLLRRSGELQQLITEMPLPNGLGLSPDGKVLYISDSHDRNWRRYPVLANGVTGPGSLFFAPDTEDASPPNGLCVDSEGNVYLTGRGGVWVVDPEGAALGLIPIPGLCAAAAFGGSDGRTLYIATDQGIWEVRMRVPGLLWTAPRKPPP